MKNYIIFILITTLFASNLFGQSDINYRVTYKTKIIKPKDSIKTKEKKDLNEQEKAIKQYTEIIFNNLYTFSATSELIIVKNESTYSTKKELDDEGIKSFGRSFFYSVTKNKGNYYYNNKTKEEIRAINVYYKDFLIIDQRDSIHWAITKENKIISNFICYKANAIIDVKDAVKKDVKKSVTAWFAPSIPVSYGPIDYNGLPGLILEINVASSYGNIITTAEKVDLNVGKFIIKKPNKGQVVSFEEFIEIGRNKF